MSNKQVPNQIGMKEYLRSINQKFEELEVGNTLQITMSEYFEDPNLEPVNEIIESTQLDEFKVRFDNIIKE